MWTIEKQMAQVGARPAGFDYMRLILSVMIIVFHSVAVCYGRDAETALWTSWYSPALYFMVPCFFALSGFLVAGSLERNSISAFVTLRVIRIFPALTVEVLVSALLIGPMVTTLGLSEYFSSGEFFKYFRNIVGDIQYRLPGVFSDHPSDVVNSQLWTVPFELECYLAIVVLALLGFVRRPRWLFAVTIGLVVVLTAKTYFVGPIWPFMPGRGLMACFLFGVALFRLRGLIPYSVFLLFFSLVIYYALYSFNVTRLFTTLPVAYITIFLGLQDPRRLLLVKGADYSYGMYLYGYPVQQTVYYFFPQARTPYLNATVSLMFAAMLAYVSWTFIEAKVVGQKKVAVSFVSSLRWLRFLQREPSQI
jgi:peptidoglycan/LPS O-acetylase OafA/YrhL